MASSEPVDLSQYEGMERTIRQYLPKDEHVVAGMLGVYAGCFLLYKALSGGDVEEIPVAVAAPTGDTSDEIPSMFDEKFEDWMAIPGNEALYEASCENIDEAAYEAQLAKLA